MRLIITRTIAAPPAIVFSVYTDRSRLPEWQPGLKGVTQQTGPIDRAGTSYVLDQPGPRLWVRVLAVDAPRFHQQLESFRWYSWVGTARFDPLPDDTTQFNYGYSPRPRGLGWLLLPLMTAIAVVSLRSEFDGLKNVAERTAAGQATGSGPGGKE